MVTIRFPFELEDAAIKEGFATGQEERFQSTKPCNDTEFVDLIQDFIHDSDDRLAYNVGFLLGLYAHS
jgi:hypothetical protein